MVQLGQAKKIGLLGGSFNPAHSGHIYISEQALNLLNLDEIWWIVAKHNPLKDMQDMALFDERFAKAKEVAGSNSKIKVLDFEKRANLEYSFDTICALKAEYQAYTFIWLMGADNLLQFPKWYRWKDIINALPIAVFNRDQLKTEALSCEVMAEFGCFRGDDIKDIIESVPPALVFMDIKIHPESSTKIRKKLAEKTAGK